MAVIAVSNPSAVFVDGLSEIRPVLAGSAGTTAGFSYYIDPTTGTALKTDGTSASKIAVRGIALQTVGAGQVVDMLEKGYLAGLDVSALAFDALVYVSDTVGRLDTAAGTNSSIVGRVVPLSDRDPVSAKPSKILFVRPSSI